MTKEVLDVVAGDIGILTKCLIKEAGVDGIYLSVQNLQDSRSSKEEYNQVIKPGELHILNRAISAGGTNILHICGYEGATNDIIVLHRLSRTMSLTGQLNWKVSAYQKDVNCSVAKQFLVALKILKKVYYTLAVKKLFKEKSKNCLMKQDVKAL